MVKINIITGFLGAGKTTFLQHMMESRAWCDEKWAIVENEFGKVGIDGSFLSSAPDVAIVEISNGCLCCTLQGEFVSAIEKLIHEHAPDRILIEPSGILVLDDLVDLLGRPPLSLHCRLQSIITIVDVTNYFKRKESFNRFLESQIERATHLVLSKTQHTTEANCLRVKVSLSESNPNAVVFDAPWDKMDFHRLRSVLDETGNPYFEKSTMSSISLDQDTSALLNTDQVQSKDPHRIQSVGLTHLKQWTLDCFHAFVKDMAAGTYGEVLRMKGYVPIDGILHEINYDDGRLHMKQLSAVRSEDDGPLSHVIEPKISFIGENLHGMLLRKIFDA